MKKLKKIILRTNCGFSLSINKHKDYYQSAQDRINELIAMDDGFIFDVSQNIIDKMIEFDNIIELQFYPDTPIGSYVIYHYDLDCVINIAHRTLFGDSFVDLTKEEQI